MADVAGICRAMGLATFRARRFRAFRRAPRGVCVAVDYVFFAGDVDGVLGAVVDEYSQGAWVWRLGGAGFCGVGGLCAGFAVDRWGLGGSAGLGGSFVCLDFMAWGGGDVGGIWVFGCGVESVVVHRVVGVFFDFFGAVVGPAGDGGVEPSGAG